MDESIDSKALENICIGALLVSVPFIFAGYFVAQIFFAPALMLSFVWSWLYTVIVFARMVEGEVKLWYLVWMCFHFGSWWSITYNFS